MKQQKALCVKENRFWEGPVDLVSHPVSFIINGIIQTENWINRQRCIWPGLYLLKIHHPSHYRGNAGMQGLLESARWASRLSCRIESQPMPLSIHIDGTYPAYAALIQ